MPLFGNVRRLCRWIKFHALSKLHPEQSHNAPNAKASAMHCKARHHRWHFFPFYSRQTFLCGKFCNFSIVFIRSKFSIYYWHQRMRNWLRTIFLLNPNFRWISFNNNIFTLLPIADKLTTFAKWRSHPAFRSTHQKRRIESGMPGQHGVNRRILIVHISSQ